MIDLGTCPDGTGRNGCGPQEQFRACADVRITEDGIPDETTPSTSTSTSTSKTTSASTVKPRTRGTVTYRTRRPNKSTTIDPVTSTTPSSTNTTSATNFETISGENAGPYVGIIIALATLLFAIAAISAVIHLIEIHIRSIFFNSITNQRDASCISVSLLSLITNWCRLN